MKKVVKSRAALNATALKSGATVTNKSGSKFNASAKKSTPVKKTVKKAPPPPAPKPDTSKLVADAVKENTAALVAMIEELKRQMQEIQVKTGEPITEWDFDFVRDENGFLERLKARVPGRTIN